MKHVLIVYYSQSGEVERVAKAFAEKLSARATVAIVPLRPREDYPYPWRSIGRFFDAMPECILGEPPPLEGPPIDPTTGFDLVIVVCPIWFLSPAPPIQSFLKTANAGVLRDTDVVTVLVSRAMWQQGSERMKQLVADAGAIHCDNVVITHQGSALLTLVSTPRALLFGKSDRLMGLFPAPGVAASDLTRIDRLAETLSERFAEGGPRHRSYLAGEPAVAVKRWLIVPELIGWYAFCGWALTLRAVGKFSPGLRAIGVYGFALFLVLMIVLVLPIVLLATLIGSPLLRNWREAYARRLAAPTEEAP